MKRSPKSKYPEESLLSVPGVGKSIAEDLRGLGIHTVNDLKNKNPEKMYEKLNKQAGKKLDRCLLYTFRCAVYFATTPNPEPEKLKWWNWKD